ncbi:AraC family transcriptional regulator [Dyadobacter sp. 676]|uniref:AraC family transcriptional regulator n=1 Tax=Dyadobacter sp. 676 TaxID=3088362 RepID=A0AAU8FJ08_9BACT
MYNWKAIAYLLGFWQGIILALSLIARGAKGQRASLFLGLILVVLAQELLNAWGMQVRYHSRPGMFPFWNFQSYLVLPLALWFFMRSVTEPAFIFKPVYGLAFLAVVAEIAVRWMWWWRWKAAAGNVTSLLDNPVWFSLTEILPIIGMVAVLGVYGMRLYPVWRMHAALKPGHYLRIFGLFGFLSLLTLLWVAGVIFGWPVFTEIEILIAACLFGLGYTGYIDPHFFALPAFPKEEKPGYSRFSDTLELQKIREIFERDRLHTRSGLTLEETADELNLPARYVSQLINTHCGTNFNGFVNAFRVEEVVRKLADPKEKHKTILALALEAGFSSKSTFNQAFRQHTGKSPSQYMQAGKVATEIRV